MTTTFANIPAFDRILIVHGLGANQHDHWFPWLAHRLPQAETFSLPDPLHPSAERWIAQTAERLADFNERTAVVAHSLGNITVLQALRRVDPAATRRLGAFVAVAPFDERLPHWTEEKVVNDSVAQGLHPFLCGYDADAARALVPRARVIRSDNDPLVQPRISDGFASRLNAPVTVVPGAGHFLANEGVTELHEVLQALRELAGEG